MDSKEKKYGSGVVAVIITPLKRNGQLDKESLERIIRHCIAGGVHGVFVLGTTGEGSCLTQEQKKTVISAAKSITGESIPLYVGVMDSSTNRVKENIRVAEDNGADIAVVTPHYYLASKSQDEITRHMKSCAKYTSVPLMVYNIPQTTNIDIALTTIEEILTVENIIGIKESSGNWEKFQKLIFLKERIDFKLLMGAEDLAGIAMLMGADGCISGISNFVPNLVVQMYEAARKGDINRVKKLQFKASRLREVSFAGDLWLAGFKYACSLLGLCQEYLSLPLQPLTEKQKGKVRKILIEEGFNLKRKGG